MPPGILWNLSSKENLKEKLSREALPELTERVLVPLCCAQDAGAILLSPSEEDVFYNATGCLRYPSVQVERLSWGREEDHRYPWSHPGSAPEE